MGRESVAGEVGVGSGGKGDSERMLGCGKDLLYMVTLSHIPYELQFITSV